MIGIATRNRSRCSAFPSVTEAESYMNILYFVSVMIDCSLPVAEFTVLKPFVDNTKDNKKYLTGHLFKISRCTGCVLQLYVPKGRESSGDTELHINNYINMHI